MTTKPQTTTVAATQPVIVNVHVLQPVPPAHLNRDETGAQKTVPMGGTLRTRVSSQCWKRAMRLQMREQAVSGGAFAHRTNYLPGEVADALVESGATDDIAVARSKAAALFLALGFGMKKSQEITNNSTYVHVDAARRIAAAMAGHLDEIEHEPGSGDSAGTGTAPESVKAAATRAFDIDGAVDLALFGSFLATKKINVRHDGAVSVNHAYSVDPAQIVDDFYVAVDDNVIASRETDDDSSAASNNMGVADLSSQVFYRTMAIDVNQLRRNLDEDGELVADVTAAAIRAFVSSVPSAKQRSTNVGTRPSLVLVSVGDSRLTADNAFTKAIRSDNVVTDAAAALFTQVEFASRFGEQQYAVLAGDAAANAQIPAEGFTVTTSIDQLTAAAAEMIQEAGK